MAEVTFPIIRAQLEDLEDYLKTAQGEADIDGAKRAIGEAIWRVRNVQWAVDQLARQRRQ